MEILKVSLIPHDGCGEPNMRGIGDFRVLKVLRSGEAKVESIYDNIAGWTHKNCVFSDQVIAYAFVDLWIDVNKRKKKSVRPDLIKETKSVDTSDMIKRMYIEDNADFIKGYEAAIKDLTTVKKIRISNERSSVMLDYDPGIVHVADDVIEGRRHASRSDLVNYLKNELIDRINNERIQNETI